MARKTKDLIIDAEGRDKGKRFFLTEMSATQAEKWAARALLALTKSGVEIPDDAAALGLAGVAAVGLKAFSGIPWELAEPLLDEMMQCVQIKTDPAHPEVIRSLIEEDIEEVATRLKIRLELLELHIGFSLAARLSTLKASAAGKASPTT